MKEFDDNQPYRGLSSFFTYYGTELQTNAELFVQRYLDHLASLCPLLEERSVESASLVKLHPRTVFILNYAILLFHILHFLYRRNYARNVEAERNVVNRTIDLLAAQLSNHGILESELTGLVDKFRGEWIAQRCPSDITLFLCNNAAKLTDPKGAAIFALSGGDVEGLIFAQICQCKGY